MRLYAAIAAGLIFALCLWLEAQRLIIKPFPPTTFPDAVSEFKYGSIGAEVNGFPYLIWRELPSIFKKELPGGWAQFGYIFEDGHDLPIGISVRRTAVNRVGFNCATCHTAKVAVDGKQMLILGAPAERLDLQAYLQFLVHASDDPRLTADAIIESADEARRPIGLVDKLVLRYFVMPRLKDEASGLRETFAWMSVKPLHGPGRTDAGNTWRQRWGMRPEDDNLVGTVDFPSVWNQKIRKNGWFHWDGNNSSLTERNYSAALAGGATDWLLDRRAIGKISEWLSNLPPPKIPIDLNAEKITLGESVFRREGCANCHQAGVGATGQVTDIDVVGTDPQRALLFSDDMVKRFHDVGKAYSWRFSHYRSSHGYANMPLDGIWARAPYLHNGAVPDLAALLSPVDDRPKNFLRGCGTFDPVRVGFRCAEGFNFVTSAIGNSNAGHLYGTNLSASDKDALIEFLKSL